MAERKSKEIGVRKVLGATVVNILRMLTTDYLKLVVIAFFVAAPIGNYVMNEWLSGFAYRISPGIPTFLLAGVLSFLIAWCTVGFESIRAAMHNPVDVLKKE